MKLSNKYDVMINSAVNGCVDYLEAYPNIKTMVLGVSGGIDSALTAVLARMVCDRLGERVRLIGQYIPIISNASDETERAVKLGQGVCHEFSKKSLDKVFINLVLGLGYDRLHNKLVHRSVELSHDERVLLGNIKARLRMINLYALAGETEGMVLSTDNLTEEKLGFWTLHGDVGDFGFLQNLWKTEVYGMAETIGDPLIDFLTAKPTDGLGVSNSDIDQLLPGIPPSMDWRQAYRVIDDMLIAHLNGQDNGEDNPVVARYKATHFKRNNPVNLKRDFLLWPYSRTDV